MTPYEKKQKYEEELLLASQNFLQCLETIDKKTDHDFIQKIDQEYNELENISKLILSSLFHRAFSEQKKAKLQREVNTMTLQIGNSLPILQQLYDKIKKQLIKQEKAESQKISILQKEISSTDYQKYDSLLHSNTFLKYIMFPSKK